MVSAFLKKKYGLDLDSFPGNGGRKEGFGDVEKESQPGVGSDT